MASTTRSARGAIVHAPIITNKARASLKSGLYELEKSLVELPKVVYIYMPTSSFEKRPNKVIYDTLNSHRPLNMYKKVIDCGYMV